MRPAAQVDKITARRAIGGGEVAVGAHARWPRSFLDGLCLCLYVLSSLVFSPGIPVRGTSGGVHSLDYLQFVRLVGENLQTLGHRVLLADKGLVLGHDLAHGGFDAAQVLGREMGASG